MSEKCKDLPDECWEIIFESMGHHSHLQTLILVCKRFLSIISLLRTTFDLTAPAILTHGENLSLVFNKFPNINSINLRGAGNSAPRLLGQIATSSLNLQSLDISECSHLSLNSLELLGPKIARLRVFKCSKMEDFSDGKLEMIANSVPWVEELDFSHSRCVHPRGKMVDVTYVTDYGIEVMSSKLKYLRKIDISGNRSVTDKSLMALSRNCEFLEQVVLKPCSMISIVGIQFLVRNSKKLTSLSLSRIDFNSPSLNLSTRDCFSCAIHLSTLDIDDADVSDDFLNSLSGSGVPLKSFALTGCGGFSCGGISVLLKRYPSLENFKLTDVKFPNHTFAVLEEFPDCFSKLTTIKLKNCDLGLSTFFMLAKSCPLLESIEMKNTITDANDDKIDFFSNPCIKYLDLSSNPYLSDKCLAVLALACPFLEILDVSFCLKITEKGISHFLNRCSNIRHLEINGCKGINICDDIPLAKLEVLRAKDTRIDDEGLAIIGNRCYELLNLDLEACLLVTTKGLRTMLERCPRLREINLRRCESVSVEIMDWMMFSRPSLRKIVLPHSSFPNVRQIRHGCYVWAPPGIRPKNVGKLSR